MEPRGSTRAFFGSLAAWFAICAVAFWAWAAPAAAAEPSREDLIKRIERLEGMLLDNQKRMQSYEKELGEPRGQLGQQGRRLGEQEAKTDQKIDAALKSQGHAAVAKDIIKGVSLSEASQTPEEKSWRPSMTTASTSRVPTTSCASAAGCSSTPAGASTTSPPASTPS